MKKITTILVIAAVFILSARGQDFSNLDFESANGLPGNPGSGTLVSVANALPGWTAFIGDNALSGIYFVSNSLGNVSGSVELEGGSLALSGNLSIGLYLGGLISQTGSVPANAESLEFEAQSPSIKASGLYVSLGGQNLPFSVLSEGPSYYLYGANIPSSLDGQMEVLDFGIQGLGGEAVLDNIEFSTSSVPEPGEWAFVGLWAAFFATHRRRGRQR